MGPATRIVLLAFAISLAGLTTTAGGQTLIWSDEFDGTKLDTDNWTYDVGGSGFGNFELQFYATRHKNIRVENGDLILSADRENHEGKEFTSARIKSIGRVAVKYATIEARIRVPNLADGLWPAFWLLGESIGQNSWPACGEIDIFEMGSNAAITAGVVNNRVGGTAHWDHLGSYAGYGTTADMPYLVYNDYHVFRLEWTPTTITTLIDGFPYWVFDISGGAPSSLEEFHEPHFIILNLAVGGINFVDISDPLLITAPFEADMHIDYVRIYDNGFTELTLADDTAEIGAHGVLTETTATNGGVAYGVDSELYIWNNMTATTTTPYEGSEAWSFDVNPGDWFGMGVYLLQNKNMQHFRNGKLHLHMKTTSNAPFRFGLASVGAGEGWVTLAPGGEEYGLVRDGQWHEVIIPLNDFPNVDFHTVIQMFMFAGDPPASSLNVSFDNIYLTPSEPLVAPENGNFGVMTDTAANKDAGEFVLGVNGEFYIWENTLDALATTPYEGASVIGLTSAPGQVWFGAAFTPHEPLNLTAFRYPNSKLSFAMKTSSSTTFKIGVKGTMIADLGQEWITFEAGNDPYGFVRDGQWHVVEIPTCELGVDLSQVSQLFEVLGTDGPISDIAFDDIRFVNGGTALTEDAGGIPTADAGADQVITLPTNSVVLNGSGADSNGTITAYAWSQVSGPSTATLSGETTDTLTASALIEGTYVFQLTVTDNDNFSGNDTVQVIVDTPEPTADAGPDQEIFLPVNSVTLFGSGSDSDGTIVSYAWGQTFGPSTATLTGENTDTLMASNLVEGVYVFDLTVTDDAGLTDADLVAVTVTNPPQNLALNMPVTVSSIEGGGLEGPNAVDGNPGTRWSSAFSDPQWITVDLGASYDITQVVLMWEAASGQAYDIDISNDASNWTTLFSTTTGAGGTEVINVSGTGRYVRMYGTVRNTPYGYSLFEFEVYGAAPVVLGDVDQDGDVDIDDVDDFVSCQLNPGSLPGCPEADVNQDSSIDGLDTGPFVDLLVSP